MENNDTKLICFDFDLTMFKEHSYSAIQSYIYATIYKQTPSFDCQLFLEKSFEDQKKEVFNGVFPNLNESYFRHPGETSTLIKKALKEGHKVAIVSYTLFPNFIKMAIEHLDLTEKERNQIVIVGGFPVKNNNEKPIIDADITADCSKGKNLHIKTAREILEKRGETAPGIENTILIDDSEFNITNTSEAGTKYFIDKNNYEQYYIEAVNGITKTLDACKKETKTLDVRKEETKTLDVRKEETKTLDVRKKKKKSKSWFPCPIKLSFKLGIKSFN